jgi:hypothetical protein
MAFLGMGKKSFDARIEEIKSEIQILSREIKVKTDERNSFLERQQYAEASEAHDKVLELDYRIKRLQKELVKLNKKKKSPK